MYLIKCQLAELYAGERQIAILYMWAVNEATIRVDPIYDKVQVRPEFQFEWYYFTSLIFDEIRHLLNDGAPCDS